MYIHPTDPRNIVEVELDQNIRGITRLWFFTGIVVAIYQYRKKQKQIVNQ